MDEMSFLLLWLWYSSMNLIFNWVRWKNKNIRISGEDKNVCTFFIFSLIKPTLKSKQNGIQLNCVIGFIFGTERWIRKCFFVHQSRKIELFDAMWRAIILWIVKRSLMPWTSIFAYCFFFFGFGTLYFISFRFCFFSICPKIDGKIFIFIELIIWNERSLMTLCNAYTRV